MFDVRATRLVEQSGLDQIVEGRFEAVERPCFVWRASGWMVGSRKRGIEQSWLGAGELEIGDADGPESKPGAGGGVRACPYLTHPVGHALAELPQRFVTNRGEQGVAIGKVAVGGIRDHADDACDLAQHNRIWPAGPR
jgi:hypothetical protein